MAPARNPKKQEKNLMKKAKLIKKDSPLQDQLRSAKRSRKVKVRAVKERTTIDVTREWIKQKRSDGPGAREAFASLFNESDPQSA
jgi:hypothetical protein